MGRVADFCMVCREVTAHTLLSSKIPSFSAAAAQAPRHIRRCESCQLDMMGYPSRYKMAVRDPALSVEQLIESTAPAIRHCLAPRLEVEERLISHQLLAAERNDLIREAIDLGAHLEAIAPHLPGWCRWMPRLGGLLTLVLLVLTAGAIWLREALPVPPVGQATLLNPSPGQIGTILFVTWVVALTSAVGLSQWHRLRLRRDVVCASVNAVLKPLEVSKSELIELARELRSLGIRHRWLPSVIARLPEASGFRPFVVEVLVP